MRPRLHLFFPENDLALASDLERYTPPVAAVKLRKAGATLPMWYGASGDSVLVQGVDAQWLKVVRERFGVDVEPYNHCTCGLEPSPWGWSKASRCVFSDIGFNTEQLPDDASLEYMRQLSHRRTAAEVASRLAAILPFDIAAPAIELTTEKQIKDFVIAHRGGSVLKLPWSSSGRGVIATDASQFSVQETIFAGMLRRQGSVMAEPRMRKVADFAMLFTMDDNAVCRFDGFSLFNTAKLGSYTGNVLAPQSELESTINAMLPVGQLSAVRSALGVVLSDVASGYRGPLGVDMMVVEADGYSLAPVVEINFRMTMGHVCHRFYERHVVAGRRGTYTVSSASPGKPSGIIAADALAGRIDHGRIDLAQPGADFSFLVSITAT